ncbi:MAG: C40 family peptidase [Bacteroidota bacterium]
MIISCTCCTSGEKLDANDPVTVTINGIVQSLNEQFIPDRRVNRLDVEVAEHHSTIVLRGETTLPTAKAILLTELDSLGITYQDSILEMPAAYLGDENYALTRHAVVNLRSAPGHSQELATQLLLGTPVRVLKQEGNWCFVQCPDGYLAWLNEGELVRMTATDLDLWKQAQRYFYVNDYGYSYTKPNTESEKVGDLAKGGLLVKTGEENGYYQLVYPDGRQAYVPRDQLADFGQWLNANPLSFANTQTFAKQQLGKPYLWGGTSPKAMDCSGFTKTVYWQQGLIIPRDASQQVHAGLNVEFDENLNGLKAGDFLFFGRYREDGSEKVTHVGIYLGDGSFIHSGADNGANSIENLLPEKEGYADHRRQSLLRAKRLQEGSAGVVSIEEHPWYSSL